MLEPSWKKKKKKRKKWYEESQTNHTPVPCSAKWAKQRNKEIEKWKRKETNDKQTFSNR